jgi:predicted enzyme involved in methoxymalonyl-ACP biosynthesis
MKVLLLSNINMQPLVPFLNPWDVTVGEFNSLILDLANVMSPAHSPDFSHILCLYDTDSLMGEVLYGEGAPEQCEFYLQALESFCQAQPGRIVITNTFCVSSGRWLNFADFTHEASLRSLENGLNERLLQLAKKYSNLLVIDIELLFRFYGEQALLSNTFWYLGRIRYSNQMLRVLANRVQQAVHAYANQSRKVLVLEQDNTQRGGIEGEVGPLGVEIY